MKNKRLLSSDCDKPTTNRRSRSQAEVRVKPTQNIFRETKSIFKNLNDGPSGVSTFHYGTGPDSYFRKSLRNYEEDIGKIVNNYRLLKLKKEESIESGLTNSIKKALDHHRKHNQCFRKPRSPLTVPSSDESTSSLKTDNYYTSRLSPRGDYDDLVGQYKRLKSKLLKASDSDIFLDTLTSPVMADEEEQVALAQEAMEEPTAEEVVPPEEPPPDTIDVEPPKEEEAPVDEPTPPVEEEPEIKTESVKDEPIVEEPEIETEPLQEEPEIEAQSVKEEPEIETQSVKEEPEIKSQSVKEEPEIKSQSVKAEPFVDEPKSKPESVKEPSIKEKAKKPSILSAKGSVKKQDRVIVDPLAETEEIVKKASSEIDRIEEEIKPAVSKEQDFKDNAVVIKEVESCERQCMEIYKILNELKTRVGELMNNETRSDEEDRELEQKQQLLNEKMHLLEEKTRRIEQLIGQSKSLNKEYDKECTEDILPKVIICGLTNDRSPNLIVCDDKKKRRKPAAPVDAFVQDVPPGNAGLDTMWRQNVPSTSKNPCNAPCGKAGLCQGRGRSNIAYTEVAPPQDYRQCVPNCTGPYGMNAQAAVPQFAKKLNESYCMQDKLAQENANLENKRYQLQTDLLNKDGCVENLQRRICGLQTEMRNVCKENTLLCDKLEKLQTSPCNRGDNYKGPRMACGKDRGICPAEVETRLNEYNETTTNLEKQLTEMETEVRTMQQEIMQVRQERLHLEQHRRMMCPQPPSQPPPCVKAASPATEGQLRELKEQYKTLEDDYKGKMTEVAGLRADVDKQKKIVIDAEEARKLAEDKNKEHEKFIKQFKLQNNKLMGSKEALVQQEQELNVAKQRYREAKDELDEIRCLVDDQDQQLQDYRQKYLHAQQQVEEQRRQIDLMELENNRVAEQVNLEIQRVKNQFQEKLQELTPLPDILKTTQLKLQEAQQMHMLAERNNEALVRELQSYRDKAADIINQMEKVRSDQELGATEKMSLQQHCDELERRSNELADELMHVQLELTKQEDLANENEMKAQEKMHEIAQLQAEMDNLREESARQVSRTKDRCETVRRSMQSQISDLERQLALSRAQARTAQKDRDEIRQKMQSQINNLNENFEDAQMRIRNLQGHVNFLKNSYTVFAANEITPQQNDRLDPCSCAPGI